jgi:hypothetical protein
MKKLHRISYPDIFSEHFSPESIDGNLKQMELDEKLFLLDNIIDYLYINFRSLKDAPPKETPKKPEVKNLKP